MDGSNAALCNENITVPAQAGKNVRKERTGSLRYRMLNTPESRIFSGYIFRHTDREGAGQDEPGKEAGRCDRRGKAQRLGGRVHGDRACGGNRLPIDFVVCREGITRLVRVRRLKQAGFRIANILRACAQELKSAGAVPAGGGPPGALGAGAGPGISPVPRDAGHGRGAGDCCAAEIPEVHERRTRVLIRMERPRKSRSLPGPPGKFRMRKDRRHRRKPGPSQPALPGRSRRLPIPNPE